MIYQKYAAYYSALQAEAFIVDVRQSRDQKVAKEKNVNIERRGCANLICKILPVKGPFLSKAWLHTAVKTTGCLH